MKQFTVLTIIGVLLGTSAFSQTIRQVVEEGETLIIDSSFPRVLNTLILKDNSVLKSSESIDLTVDSLILGKNVTITTEGTKGEDGVNRTGTAPRKTTRGSGTTGVTGDHGGNGPNGISGKKVTINANIVHLVSFKVITNGGQGGNGGNGQKGGKGSNAECPASNGGTGGKGGNAGDGGNGGDAGKALITYNEFRILPDPNSQSIMNSPLIWIAEGGEPGKPGKPGSGGDGGNSGCCADCPWPTKGCCAKVDGGDRGRQGNRGQAGIKGESYDTSSGWFVYNGSTN